MTALWHIVPWKKRDGIYLFRNILLLIWVLLRETETCINCCSAVEPGKRSRGVVEAVGAVPRPRPSSQLEWASALEACCAYGGC